MRKAWSFNLIACDCKFLSTQFCDNTNLMQLLHWFNCTGNCYCRSLSSFLVQFMSCVHMLQVKVLAKLTLKLIVMISLSICVMTKKACIDVLSVREVFQMNITWCHIWLYIRANTSALSVERFGLALMRWKCTCEDIRLRDRLNVVFVANDSLHHNALLLTAEFTVERNHTNVTCVTGHLVSREFWTIIRESTQEANLTNVACVTRHLVTLAIYTFTLESTQERNHTSVQCVTNVSSLCVTYGHMIVKYTAT